jgi:chromosome segregation ATPase
MANLSISIFEIILLMFGAIVLGITIHFFITSRRHLKNSVIGSDRVGRDLEQWKLRYFNDMEEKEKELGALRKQITDAEESGHNQAIELEELQLRNKRLQTELDAFRKAAPSGEKPDYISQLRQAQSSLLEHNEKINQLLGQIEIVKETEERQQEMLRDNEILSGEIEELKQQLYQKEKEVNVIRQKENLTREMSSMLDSAYGEFNTLQGKIQKLESQVSSSRMVNMEFEDLKEAHYKLSRDFEEQKVKYNATVTSSRQMELQLSELEDKLKEANTQRQQLQKKVAYLEELNNDLQFVADANKKLEGQLKRIGELESKLHMVSEERDKLASRQ